MIVYKDLLNNEEVGSDSAGTVELKEYDNAIFTTESKLIKVGGEQIDTGANASAEEASEQLEDEVKQVLNVVSAHKLVKQNWSKDQFKDAIKGYMANLKAAFPANHEDAKKAAVGAAIEKNIKSMQKFVMDVLKSYSEFDVYLSENGIIGNAQPILAKYADGASAPVFYYIACGLKQEKY